MSSARNALQCNETLSLPLPIKRSAPEQPVIKPTVVAVDKSAIKITPESTVTEQEATVQKDETCDSPFKKVQPTVNDSIQTAKRQKTSE